MRLKFKKHIQLSSNIYKWAVIAIIIALLATTIAYFLAPFSNSKQVEYIYIDNDDNQDSIIAKLSPFASKRGISSLATLMRHSHYNSNIYTGKYAIQPDETSLQVLRHLKGHMQTPVRITIPEAKTMERLARFLGSKLMIDSTTIANALNDSNLCAAYGFSPQTIPALFIPDTYEVYWDTDLHAFLNLMKSQNNKFWNSKRLQLADSINLSPIQVATLASIIDEETNNIDEKPIIAGMYLNRLKANMPLQACPTIKFALKDFSLKRILNKHLKVDSPYNTYLNTGLPPGPIKIPSQNAIDAVLNFTPSNYLYMCAKDDFSGSHYFSDSYYQHIQFSKKYHKALSNKGIE